MIRELIQDFDFLMISLALHSKATVEILRIASGVYSPSGFILVCNFEAIFGGFFVLPNGNFEL